MSDPRATLRAVVGADRTARRRLVVAAGSSVAAMVALLAFLLVLAAVVDRVFIDGAGPSGVRSGLVALAALALVRAAALGVAEVSGESASGHLRRSLRARVLGRFLDGSPGTGPSRRTGEAAATLGEGIDALDPYVTSFVPASVLAVVGPFLVFGAIAVLDPLSTLVLLFAGPMLILLLAVIGRRTRSLTARRLDELGWLNAFYLDLLHGMGTLTSFNRGADAADRIEEVSRRHGATTMEVLRTAFQTSLVMEWAATAATALVAVVVSFRLVADDLTYGTALAVLVLTPEFFVPLRRLAVEYHAGQTGNAAWEQLSPLLVAAAPGPGPGPTAAPPPPGSGEPPRSDQDADEDAGGRIGPPRIEFRGVRVTHPGAAEAALAGVDLDLAPGEVLALVGPSGAGKTTVASTLLRLVDPDDGEVLVDGRPLAGMDVRAWRRRLAWVPQSPTVFAGTVADNIRLGRPDADIAAVTAAAAVAGADGFVGDLPDGYDTVLGEGGLRLSGGQRQRVAVARAVLRDAPVVVLDEFTAHLDPGTEVEVLDAMVRLLRGRTALVIAHRLRTALAADRIAVVTAGRVVDTGTHDELLDRCEPYAELVGDHRDGLRRDPVPSGWVAG